MSQGHSGAGISDEGQPNLVPLLDLVLQLILFFMMCANFVMEQVDQTVMLPVAQMAKPMRETGSDVVFLNINADGAMLVVGRPAPLSSDGEISGYLHTVADEARKRKPDQKIDTLVIVRADKEVPYSGVFRILKHCQEAGLHNLQLRAMIPLRQS
ncbi:MAG: ExbD/TolR family protein [Gemmataceae bacterium]